MPTKSLIWLVPAAVYGFLLWIVYLLIARPRQFVEWFVRRTYRSWGIGIVIEDEEKLQRKARFVGQLLLVFIIAHATVVFGALLRCR